MHFLNPWSPLTVAIVLFSSAFSLIVQESRDWAVRPAEIRGVSPGTPTDRQLLAEIALGIHILGARLGPLLRLDYIGAAIFLG